MENQHAHNLSGRRVLITGGSGDLGQAMATRLGDAGASVVRADLTHSEGHGLAVTCDVTRRPQVEEVIREYGPFDVVFANAGIVESAPFLKITTSQWDRHLSVNLTGVFHTVQAAAQTMSEAGIRGHIVITGSWVGEVPWPEIAAYSATKAAVTMLARSAARELASMGIRVNVLAPGIVKAGLAKHQMDNEPQYAARVSRAIPIGRPQEASEIADAALFLASDAARTMTGATLLVDGGCSLFQFD